MVVPEWAKASHFHLHSCCERVANQTVNLNISDPSGWDFLGASDPSFSFKYEYKHIFNSHLHRSTLVELDAQMPSRDI
jgi:hypothetical protein